MSFVRIIWQIISTIHPTNEGKVSRLWIAVCKNTFFISAAHRNAIMLASVFNVATQKSQHTKCSGLGSQRAISHFLYGKMHLKIYCDFIHTINLFVKLFLYPFSCSSYWARDGFTANFIYCIFLFPFRCINLMSIYLSMQAELSVASSFGRKLTECSPVIKSLNF